MNLKSILLGATVAVGISAVGCRDKSEIGYPISSLFRAEKDGMTHIAREYEHAVLTYEILENNTRICWATTTYNEEDEFLLSNTHKYNAEMAGENPIGAARLLYDKSVEGYVIMDIKCDGKAETFVQNDKFRNRSISVRTGDRGFGEEHDIKLEEIATRLGAKK